MAAVFIESFHPETGEPRVVGFLNREQAEAKKALLTKQGARHQELPASDPRAVEIVETWRRLYGQYGLSV